MSMFPLQLNCRLFDTIHYIITIMLTLKLDNVVLDLLFKMFSIINSCSSI